MRGLSHDGSPDAATADTARVLTAFAVAWAARSAESVANLMTADCRYEASVGPEPGRTFHGRAQLIEGLRLMFAHDRASRIEISDQFICGDRAAWEWRYYSSEGALLARGCDLFQIRGGQIAVKNAFRKAEG